MPAPRIQYTTEQIEWRTRTVEALRAAGASSSPAQAYERLGAQAQLTRIYLDPRSQTILVEQPQRPGMVPSFAPITTEAVAALGAAAII